jgi:hypothetical protein
MIEACVNDASPDGRQPAISAGDGSLAHSLDPELVRDVVAKAMLGEQPPP